LTDRTNWPAGSLNRLLGGILRVVHGGVALGVGVLADAGAGEVGALLAGRLDPGADDGTDAGSEHPAAASAAAERSSAGIPRSLHIPSA
jgi:hypothetical protein